MPEVGIITEQGDLGLGFDPLSQKDKKVYSESSSNNQNEDKKENK